MPRDNRDERTEGDGELDERGEEQLEGKLTQLIAEVEDWDLNTELEEVYTHVAAANQVFNRHLQVTSPSSQAPAKWSLPGSSKSGSQIKKKLKKWINKLKSKLRTIARNHGADSFSISAGGVPFSVSVSVTYDV